jgi:hypothetical protein
VLAAADTHKTSRAQGIGCQPRAKNQERIAANLERITKLALAVLALANVFEKREAR